MVRSKRKVLLSLQKLSATLLYGFTKIRSEAYLKPIGSLVVVDLDSVALVKDCDLFSSFSVPIVSAFVLFLVLETIPGLMIDLLFSLAEMEIEINEVITINSFKSIANIR
jgi:hypothetical protein